MTNEQIARKLDATAAGVAFYGEALREATALPCAKDYRDMLGRYSSGNATATDHIALQELANLIRAVSHT